MDLPASRAKVRAGFSLVNLAFGQSGKCTGTRLSAGKKGKDHSSADLSEIEKTRGRSADFEMKVSTGEIGLNFSISEQFMKGEVLAKA